MIEAIIICPQCGGKKSPSHAKALCIACYRANAASRPSRTYVYRTQASRTGYDFSETQLESLRNHIAGATDWQRQLLPLFLFKGTQPYRTRSMWNVAYAMYLAEAPHVLDGRKVLVPDGDHGKLCGITKVPTHNAMRGIFGRLRACRDLTDSISKAFTEYVEWVHPAPCVYIPVPYESKEPNHAWWRVSAKPARRVFKLPDAKPADRAYPYLASRTPEQELVSKIYAVIPKSIPHEIRGDLCQDIIVGVLSGETTIENVPNVIANYASRARKIMPDRWKHISIDDVIPGTDGLHILDTMERCTENFADELIETMTEAEEAHDTPAVFWKQNGIDPSATSDHAPTVTVGSRVRVRRDRFRYLSLMHQSLLFDRAGVVVGHVNNKLSANVDFPAMGPKKPTMVPLPWDVLELVPFA